MTFNGTSLTLANDASISGLTVGKGGGSNGLNTAFGVSALAANSGVQNTAVGYQSLYSNTTGTPNTAVGYQAGYSNTTGDVCAVGSLALQANTTGIQNTAFGRSALQANTTGNQGAAFGQLSLVNNTTGGANASFGNFALQLNTTGSNNTAIGNTALNANTTASNNTAVGYQAGYGITTGGANTIIGQGCASNLTTGNNGVYIGVSVSASGSAVGQEIAIGYGATGKGSNTGFISPNGGAVYQGNNSSTWSTTSDQRLKKNIVDNTVGLSAINAIQVRNFEYRTADEVTDLPKEYAIDIKGVQLGAIAQELIQVLPDCVKTESTGVMSVDTTNITWHLINAVKELSAEVTALKAKLGA